MGNKYQERIDAYKKEPGVHYNCAQSVVMAFAQECGLEVKQASKVAAMFGSGMKMAATCGAITGGLMVIGLLGGGDDEYRAFMNGMKNRHDGMTECRDLLKKNAELHGDKKTHCDGMVADAIELVSEIMSRYL